MFKKKKKLKSIDLISDLQGRVKSMINKRMF